MIAEPRASAAAITHLERDPELSRACIGLGQDRLEDAYWLARHLTVEAGGGVIDQEHFIAVALASGLFKTRKHILYDILPAGDGLFWHERANGKIGIRRWSSVAADITKLAVESGKPELVSTNLPGAPLVSVPIMPTLKENRSKKLAAWFNLYDPDKRMSNFTQGALFGRKNRKTPLGWRKNAHIKSKSDVAIYNTPVHPHKAFPVVGYVRNQDAGFRKQLFWQERFSNRYTAPAMAVRDHHRTPRDVRRRAEAIRDSMLVDAHGVGLRNPLAITVNGVVFSKTGRMVFEDSHGKRYTPAERHLRRHYKKYHDNDLDGEEGDHYLRRKPARHSGVIEYARRNYPDSVDTFEGFTSREEADRWFAKHGGRASIRAYGRSLAA